MVIATKKCPKCGWEYPVTFRKRKCRFCHEYFNEGFCHTCGAYAPMYRGSYNCKKCDSIISNGPAYNYRKYWKVVDTAEDRFDEWVDMMSKVKRPLRTLTQEEWLEACNYFGKCAFCNNESIDARGFFMPFKFGGRYANWNVLPVCEQCATSLKRQQNPFIRYHPWLNQRLKARGLNLKTLDNITAYLRPRLEAAINGDSQPTR